MHGKHGKKQGETTFFARILFSPGLNSAENAAAAEKFEQEQLTEGEYVRPLVVELALEALGRHPVGRADLGEAAVEVGRAGDLRGEAEVRDDGGEVALLGPTDQHILRKIIEFTQEIISINSSSTFFTFEVRSR